MRLEPNEKSIFHYILTHQDQGILPDNFRLPRKRGDKNLTSADGAEDAKYIYHMGQLRLGEEDIEEIGRAIVAASAGEQKAAEQLFIALGNKYRIIKIADQITGYVMDHISELNTENIYRFAFYAMQNSEDIECVKAGLYLMTLFQVPEEMKDHIRILGLSDEFTAFVLFLMRRWQYGNLEIFMLAQRLHGWGRILAVNYLKPDPNDPEIREWILMEGIQNNVMYAYTALMCYEKGGAWEMLSQPEISYEHFHAIGIIIEALLVDGPMPNIVSVKNSNEMFCNYLKHAMQWIPLAMKDYDIIHQISQWLEANGKEGSVTPKTMIHRIFDDVRCRRQIITEVEQGNYIQLAKAQGIPYLEELYQQMSEDIIHMSKKCKYLMESEEYQRKTVNLFIKKLPLEDMKNGPSKARISKKEQERYLALSSILMELQAYPGLGVKLVETGIQTPFSGTRYAAVLVMQHWVAEQKQPIKQMAPVLHRCLTAAIDVETEKNIKKGMLELL